MEISLYALDYSDFADDSTFAYGCERKSQTHIFFI